MSRICPHCEYDLDRGLCGAAGSELDLGLDPEASEVCPDCQAEVCLHCPGECPAATASSRRASSARAA